MKFAIICTLFVILKAPQHLDWDDEGVGHQVLHAKPPHLAPAGD